MSIRKHLYLSQHGGVDYEITRSIEYNRELFRFQTIDESLLPIFTPRFMGRLMLALHAAEFRVYDSTHRAPNPLLRYVRLDHEQAQISLSRDLDRRMALGVELTEMLVVDYARGALGEDHNAARLFHEIPAEQLRDYHRLAIAATEEEGNLGSEHNG